MDFQPPGVNETGAGRFLALKVVSTVQGPAAKLVETTQDVELEASFGHDSIGFINREPRDDGSTQSSSHSSGDEDQRETDDMEISSEMDLIQDLDEDNETPEEWKERLANFFRQMMFVSGETAEASAETTTLIEEIVRQQVIEMVSAIQLPSSALFLT